MEVVSVNEDRLMQQQKVEMDVSYVNPEGESGFCSNDAGTDSSGWERYEGEISDSQNFDPEIKTENTSMDDGIGVVPWKSSNVKSDSESCDISAIKPKLIKSKFLQRFCR